MNISRAIRNIVHREICLLCVALCGIRCNFFLCVLTLVNYFLIVCVLLPFDGEIKMYIIVLKLGQPISASMLHTLSYRLRPKKSFIHLL